MKLRILSFTDRGYALACRIAALTDSPADRCESGGLSAWTEQAFASADTLLYVGAAGIAVRAIAPYVCHKAKDPAVLVCDEMGTYMIPILSGHLGGANAAAEKLAALIGAIPVITTATDRNGVFAIDVWAKNHGCAVANPEQIKRISGALLRGKTISVFSEFPISGNFPDGVTAGTKENCDAAIGVHTRTDEALLCVPRCLTVGVGCKKGISKEKIAERISLFLSENHLSECAVEKISTIDRKQKEPGLLAFCEEHRLPLVTFSAEELKKAPGSFSASAFVAETVGVDNVCERSAVLCSGGKLIAGKFAGEGVTAAAAIAETKLDWG